MKEENSVNIIIEKLVKRCNLGEIIENPIRVSGGLLNRMYKVKTTIDTYAIKLLNPEVMKRENAISNHIFAEKVSNIAKDNGVSCLPAKVIDNEVLQKIENYYFLVFNWFDGYSIKDEELTLDKCKKVAKELSKLHKIDYAELKEKCKAYYDTNEIDWIFYLKKIDNNKIKKLLTENIEKFRKLDKEAIKNLEIISKNMLISHRDLDLPNILWNKDGEPVLIDWESSGLINPSMEVIDTAWNWSGGQKYFDKNKFKVFVNTYKENGGDLSDFGEALKADYKAKFGWLEYNLKRVTGIECIDDEERMLGEKEVIRSIDEINHFYLYSGDMKI